MATLVQLLPMELFFVLIFAVLPISLSIYEKGFGDITPVEWVSFALLAVGAVLVYVVSDMTGSVQMQRYLWPLLSIMALGLLVYRLVLMEEGKFDEDSIERGGTSYED